MHRPDTITLLALTLGLAATATACNDPARAEGDGAQAEDGGTGGLPDGGIDDGVGDGIDDGIDDGGDDGGVALDIGGGAGPEPEPDEPPPPDERPMCDEENPVTLYLSPDDSNSMSSPVQVREAVLSGDDGLIAAPVRTWEFFNYYTFDYPPAPAGALELTVELHRPDDAPEGEFLLQIGVSSEAIAEVRPPMNLTLVLDASGSMEGHPMNMLKASCRAIAASLREGDVVSMVTWDTTNAVVLGGYTVEGPDDPALLAKIDAIAAGGGTDLHGGLTAGYELAQQVYDPARINRVVLVSDGGANAGVTDIEIIAQGAGDQDAEGIYLVGAGVGTAATYHDELLDDVTDAGKGASVFIPDGDEAWKVFHEQFAATMLVAARDVQVRVDLPPGFRFITFSGEEMSRDPAEIEPQHVAPGDAVVFHQKISSCAPHLLGPESAFTVTASWDDAITYEPHELTQTHTFDVLADVPAPRLHKGAALLGYATALQAYKAALDQAARDEAIAQGLAAVDEADALLPGDPDLAEIRQVLEALQ